jgi:Protein of unknown function (DUF3352)
MASASVGVWPRARQEIVQTANSGGRLHAQRSSVARAYDRPMRRPLRHLAIALPLLALGAAGCGGSAKKPGPDPASLVPTTAPLYASAIVRPEGSLKSNAVADGRALTHQSEPFAALLGGIQVGGKSSSGHPTPVEIESWLGERAGIFITHLGVPAIKGPGEVPGLLEQALSGALFATSASGGAHAEGALVLDVADFSKASAFVRAAPASRSATFDGIRYAVAPNGEVFGLVGGFVVIGTESGMKEVIAVANGGPALDGNTTYTSLRDSAAKEGVLANLYVQPTPLVHATHVAPGTTSQLFSLLRALAPSGALYLSLAPESHRVRLDLDASSGSQPQAPSASESEQAANAQQAFQALPEDSWFALRLNDFGAFAEHLLGLAAVGAGAGGGNVLHGLLGSLGGSFGSLFSSLGPSLDRLLASLAANRAVVDKELLSWMGPAGVFVSGSSLAEFNAAAVIDAKEPALAREAVAKLPSILAGSGAAVKPTTVPEAEAAATVNLKGLPVPLQVGAGKGKFIIGLGLAPVEAALTPSGTLGSSTTYQQAVKSLGEGMQPALLLSVPTLVSFANLLGLGSSGTLAQVLPYLKTLTTVTAGTKQLGNVSRTRIMLGVG